MQVRFRCPHCKKLYSAQRSALPEGLSSFACTDCETKFYFQSDWINPGEIVPTFIEGQQVDGQLSQKLVVTEPCPKCGALNLKTGRECYSCGVLFEKVRGLPKDSSLNATPSLVRLWEEVINNFEDVGWHDQFIKACDRANALAYAAYQFRMIINATGGDLTAIESLKKVEVLQTLKLMPKKRTGFFAAELGTQFVLVAPFLLGLGLVIVGLSVPSLYQHIGNGIAVLCVSAGVTYFVKDYLLD